MSVARRRRPSRRVGGYAFAGVVITLSAGPLVLGLITALTPAALYDRSGPALVPAEWTLGNFAAVWNSTDFATSAAITTAACVVLCAAQVPLSAAAAFVFARIPFPGRRPLFGVLLATLAVPPVLTVIPLYLALSAAGLRATFWGIVAPFLLASPYAIFLLREFYRRFPDEILDAARLDGASVMQIFFRIAVPMSWNALMLVGFITIITQWNAFLWPRVISGTSWPVVTVAVASLPMQHDPQWPLVLSGTTLSAIPAVLALAFFTRSFSRVKNRE